MIHASPELSPPLQLFGHTFEICSLYVCLSYEAWQMGQSRTVTVMGFNPNPMCLLIGEPNPNRSWKLRWSIKILNHQVVLMSADMLKGHKWYGPNPNLTHLLFRLTMQILTNLKFRGKYFTVINGNALMSDHPEHLFYLWAHIWLTQRIHLQSTCTSSNITPIKVFSFFFCSESPGHRK